MEQPRQAPHIEALLPAGVVAFELYGGASPDHLFPVERECIARAVDGRRREFAAGRLCARAGLAELGFDAVALPSRRDRVPEWPSGVVGSITHTNEYCLAVVGLRSRLAAVGVDAERIGGVNPELWRFAMRAEEQSLLAGLDEASRRRIATVIFSAKEAFYKCQYALTRRWLGFEDVVATVGDGVFSIGVMDPSHPARRLACAGRFCIVGQVVITTTALSADTFLREDAAARSSSSPTASMLTTP